jgi:lipopolysaccharide biosynthesis glycosyltransferase
MSDPLRIVIGYDRHESAAYHTLCHSILTRSSLPVSITPLYLPQLQADNLIWRQDRGSTDFSFSRFLAPYLSGYRGKVLFLDCDMLCLGDIAELFHYIGIGHDVAVVKHDYRPTNPTKFLGNKQEAYPKKLWSAVCLYNAYTAKCQRLSPKLVNESEGSYLHQFQWTHDSRIADIPEEWHYVPNHSEPRVSKPKLIHFTEGGPYFKACRDVPMASLWWEEYHRMCEVEGR